MARRNIKKIVTPTRQTNDNPEKHFPRVSIRPNRANAVVPQGRQMRRFNKRPPTPAAPIVFMQNHHLPKPSKDICFVIGGGPSLSGFDFNEAWSRVHKANMKKVRCATKRSPIDIIKPLGWKPPNLKDLCK